MSDRFLKWLLNLDDCERIVRVKSWLPSWGYGGVGWPVLLVDRYSARMTVTPIWDRTRLASFIGRRPAVVCQREQLDTTSGGPCGNRWPTSTM